MWYYDEIYWHIIRQQNHANELVKVTIYKRDKGGVK